MDSEINKNQYLNFSTFFILYFTCLPFNIYFIFDAFGFIMKKKYEKEFNNNGNLNLKVNNAKILYEIQKIDLVVIDNSVISSKKSKFKGCLFDSTFYANEKNIKIKSLNFEEDTIENTSVQEEENFNNSNSPTNKFDFILESEEYKKS